MKRSKRLYLMLGVLAVVCIATFAVTHREEQKEQIKNSGEIILALDSDAVTSLRWEYGGASLAFHKDESWLYDADEAFPVSEEKVRQLLEEFEAFGVSFVIEEVSDFGMYGLDEPVCTIWLQTDQQSYEIALGDFSNMDEERYVSIGDGKVYLAKNDPLDRFDIALEDMIAHDEPLSYTQVSQIRFEGRDHYTVVYQEDSQDSYCAEDRYFTEQNGRLLPLDTDRVEYYLEGLVTLQLDHYVTYKATQEELEAYGLDNPELTLTIDYTADNEEGQEEAGTYTLSVSRDPEELAQQEAADTEEEEEETITAYARVGDSPIVYQIDASEYLALMTGSYNDLRHRDVLTADFADICRIDVSLEGEDYSFLTEGEKDEERTWKYEDEEISMDALQKELYSLKVESSDDFVSEKPGGKKELGLKLTLSGEEGQEQVITIDLYRYDGEHCLAQVNGETFARIPRADVVDLMEAVNAIVLS